MKAATNSSPRTLWPLLAVLGSAAGLLALSASALVRSLHDAETRAELLASREAERVADAVRVELTRVEALGLPAANRFAVRAGALVVPDEVGWIEPDGEDRGADLASGAAVDDRAAQGAAALARREAAGEPIEALVTDWRALLAEAADAPAARRAARLAAAWFAERHRLLAWRDELRTDLREELSGLASRRDPTAGSAGPQLRPWSAAVDAGTLSLAMLDLHADKVDAEARSLRSAQFLGALGRLPPAHADALLARCVELGATDATVAGARAHLAAVQARRRTLAQVQPTLTRLVAAREPLAFALGEQLVAYVPTGEGEGVGVRAPARAVIAPLVAGARPAASVAVAWAPDLPDAAASIVRGVVGVVPVRIAAEPPWALASLVLALAGLFAGALATTLRGLRQQARAQQARSEFLTSVTHELKTPLASLRLLSELLADGRVAEPAQRQEYYELLASETGRLSALVENVLDLGRTERGERGYDMQVLDVRAWVADTLALFAPVAAREGLTLALRAPAAEEEVAARGDRDALTQALLNVLDNARKYGSSPAGIEVDVHGAEATEGTVVQVVVRDHGPGLAAGERERVFERFARGGTPHAAPVPGLGLGLYLARAILRAHGGDLEARAPSAGGGVEMVFTLPRVPRPDGGGDA